jgi:WD40 repeat protein
VSGLGTGFVQIWNAATGEIECTLGGHSLLVTSVDFSPDGRRVVSGSGDNIIRIWDVGNKERKPTGYSEAVLHNALAWIRNAGTGKKGRKLKGHSDMVNSVAFSPDGKRVVSGSNDNSVRIWNVAKGRIEHIMRGHSGGVRSVAFSPDGTLVVSGAWDGIRIWNVATGEIERVLEGHTD